MSKNKKYTISPICASAQSLFAFLIVQYMKVEASGDYYNAWRSEEGAANEKWMIYLQFALWYNTWVWFFLCKKNQNLQHLPKPQSLLLHNCHVISHSICKQSLRIGKKSCETAIKIQKSGGWGSGSYLWRRWRRGVRPMAHWSLGSRERRWTVPGGCGPSTDRPASWWTNLQYHTRSVFKKKKKKVSAGTKRKITWEEKMLCQLDAVNTTCHNCFGLSIYVKCQISVSQGPPSLRVLVTQMWRLHPRSRGASQN